MQTSETSECRISYNADKMYKCNANVVMVSINVLPSKLYLTYKDYITRVSNMHRHAVRFLKAYIFSIET